MAILIKTSEFFQCEHCRYEWRRRKKKGKGKPKICPRCKRTNWNEPKQEALAVGVA